MRNVLGQTPRHLKVPRDQDDRLAPAHLPFGVEGREGSPDVEAGLEDAIAVLALPAKYRRRLRTTNMVERLIKEIRRRERVIRIFPNSASAERLIGALLQEQHEQWLTGQKRFDMNEYVEWRQARRVSHSEAASIQHAA